ncbi:hypothetical protein [Nocardia mexicana]|uniref:hypothetical protein n=1 Tax=Nocardia mexicana TaxID=279262 RepID=UPI0020D2833C|nr:hypothetical protein [Nocardia mexicana]
MYLRREFLDRGDLVRGQVVAAVQSGDRSGGEFVFGLVQVIDVVEQHVPSDAEDPVGDLLAFGHGPAIVVGECYDREMDRVCQPRDLDGRHAAQGVRAQHGQHALDVVAAVVTGQRRGSRLVTGLREKQCAVVDRPLAEWVDQCILLCR